MDPTSDVLCGLWLKNVPQKNGKRKIQHLKSPITKKKKKNISDSLWDLHLSGTKCIHHHKIPNYTSNLFTPKPYIVVYNNKDTSSTKQLSHHPNKSKQNSQLTALASRRLRCTACGWWTLEAPAALWQIRGFSRGPRSKRLQMMYIFSIDQLLNMYNSGPYICLKTKV